MMKFTIVEAGAVQGEFIALATRDLGMTYEQACEELTCLFAAPLIPVVELHYLTVSRVGASFPINRAMRQRIWATFQSAINFGTFDRPV